MTAQASATTTGSSHRSAGWAAIASGVIGIMAFGSLTAAVQVRSEVLPHAGDLMFRAHDVGLILQSLFLVPVAFGLHALSPRWTPGVSRAMLAVGVVSLSSMVLLLSLVFVTVVWDALYTVPQAVLGVWLMVVNRRLSRALPRGLTWLGTVAGLGLALVGIFPLAYPIFVEPVGFRGPSTDDAAPPTTTANIIIHLVLYIGTFMGVATFPIWTILLGRRMLREGRS